MPKTRLQLLEELNQLHGREGDWNVDRHNLVVSNQVLSNNLQSLQQRCDEQAGELTDFGRVVQDLNTEIDRVRADTRKMIAAAQAEVAQAKKEAAEISSENTILRDRLHGMSLENARLEGWRERVVEFDPLSDKQLHAEGRPLLVNSAMFPPAPMARMEADERANGSSGYRRETWFQRRAQ